VKASPIRVLQPRIDVLYQGYSKDGPHLMRRAGRFTTLRARRQAGTREQPATETVIIVAIRRSSGAILLAGLCNETANLPGRFGERALVVLRLMARHLGDQQFKIVGHTLLRKLHDRRRRANAPVGRHRERMKRSIADRLWTAG
jgi:hypothetical protein